MEPTVARSQIGRFGITGDAQTAQMKNLSDGQKSRVRAVLQDYLDYIYSVSVRFFSGASRASSCLNCL